MSSDVHAAVLCVPALLTTLLPTPLWFWQDANEVRVGRQIRIRLPSDYVVRETVKLSLGRND